MYLLKLSEEKLIVIYFIMNFIDFLQLQKRKMGSRGVLNISYLTFSPKALHRLKKNLTGSKYPRSSLKFVHFGLNQFSVKSISSFSKKIHVYLSIQCVHHNYLLTK